MKKPTAKQTAWVFKKLLEHIKTKKIGTYRYLIHDRMGYPQEDYFTLLDGLELNNHIFDYQQLQQNNKINEKI
jgi:hypothetical protein